MVDDKVLFSMTHGDDNELLVSLTAFDSNDEVALKIEDNEWLLGTDNITDW